MAEKLHAPTLRFGSTPGRCSACGASLPEMSRFCPSCGAGVSSSSSPKNDAESLLSEANLLRVRGEWSGAEAKCIEVMRHDANNHHAYSLIGDIYRDQNKLEEAVQWYQLALDLAPDSASDRAKLKSTEDEIGRKLARGAAGFDAVRSSPDPHPSGTQNIAGMAPSTWLKLIWVGIVAFAIVTVILIVALRNRAKEGPLGSRGTINSSDVTVESPAGTMKGASRANPFPLLSTAGRAPTTSRPPSPNQRLRPNAPAPATTAGISERESALQARLGAQVGSSPTISLGPVTVDPREQRATVVLIEHPTASPVSEAVRAQALRDAYQAGMTAFTADAEIQRATIYVRVAYQDGAPQALFAGDLDRKAIERGGSAPDDGQITSAFTNTWWAPADSQGEATQSTPSDSDR